MGTRQYGLRIRWDGIHAHHRVGGRPLLVYARIHWLRNPSAHLRRHRLDDVRSADTDAFSNIHTTVILSKSQLAITRTLMSTTATALRALRGLLLAGAALLNLSAQSGNVAGTVTDSSLNGALVGARVEIEGRRLATATDDSGRYLLLGVPAGAAKLTVSYLGLEATTQEVQVTAGSTATLDFALNPAALSSSITVSAGSDLVGQARALNDQKNSQPVCSKCSTSLLW